MLLKKIVNTLCAVGVVASVSMPVFAEPSNGLYLGAGLGVTINTSNANSGSNYRGLPLNVMAGYGVMADQNLYLAGELSGTLGTAVINNPSNLKSTWGYGLSFIPGLLLSQHTMGFVRLGAVRTEFTGLNDEKTGMVVGLGLQTSVLRAWDLRAEYDYTRYSHSIRTDQVGLAMIYKFI